MHDYYDSDDAWLWQFQTDIHFLYVFVIIKSIRSTDFLLTGVFS